VEDRSKSKYIHKNEYDHRHVYIENILVIEELFYGSWGGVRQEKANERKLKVSKCITSVQVDDITKHTENC
jgi:hypothetical protein